VPRDALFKSFRKYVLAFPDAREEFPWGDVAFKVGGKMFAATGEKGDPFSVTVKLAEHDREGALALPFVEVARYVGRFGWCTIHVKNTSQLAAAKKWAKASYALVLKRTNGSRRRAHRNGAS
jgi:predicted DNA-binding protein (MmcQ/YjbR family)